MQGDVGIARLFDGGSASGGLRIGQRWLSGERYSDGIGPWARDRLRLTSVLRIDAALGAERRSHPEHPGLDSWTAALRPGLDYTLNSRTTLRAEFELEHVDAREDRHGSRLGGLGLGVSHAFEGDLSVSPRISVHWRRYADKDPLFRKRRSDRQTRVSVNLLHRALQYRGFAPCVGFFVERNSYRNQGAMFGVSKTF